METDGSPPEDPPPPPSSELVEARPRYWADRLDRRLVVALTVAGFALPVLGYLWFVQHYGVNAVVGDQWDDVTVIRNSYLHGFDWSSLWTQHNENRILFPNLIVIFLARTTHFDVRIEELLGAAMLLASLFLLIATHRRRSPTTPWLYYCPVAILGLSFVQWSNSTWGFQMAWYLVLLSLALAIFLLDRPVLTPLVFALATAAAVVGSFSSLQGLLIWVAGLVLLYHRRRRWPYVAVWGVAAAVTVALYFYHYKSQGPVVSPTILFHYPIAGLKFYLFALGDVVGVALGLHQVGSPFVTAFGAVILILAVTVLVVYGPHRDQRGARPIGLALIVWGLGFDALITEGRIAFGYFAASASRYTTFDLLVPIGIYLTLLEHPGADESPVRAVGVDTPSSRHSPIGSIAVFLHDWGDRWLLSAGRIAIIVGSPGTELEFAL